VGWDYRTRSPPFHLRLIPTKAPSPARPGQSVRGHQDHKLAKPLPKHQYHHGLCYLKSPHATHADGGWQLPHWWKDQPLPLPLKTSRPIELMDTICTNMDQTCINNNQTSELETTETDPATESVNTDDSSSNTPVQRSGPETATNPLQLPITDIESNTSGVECRNN
jgi:hypothetical protein